MITRPALPGELATDTPRLGFPRPARIPEDFMSLAEREYLDRHGPVKHAQTAELIAADMAADSLVPSALCECDDCRCLAHDTVSGIVQSRFSSGRRAVWLIDVQRAIRLMILWRRKLPLDFEELVENAWGDDSLPEPADLRELRTRYETERPAYAAHGCSVAYTVESLVGDLRSERRESWFVDRGVELAEEAGEL